MKHVARAFAPGNISCLFAVCPHKDPAKMGSLGLGFTINKGATVSVRTATKTAVFFNGKPINFPTILYVIKALSDQPLSVAIRTPLPLGSGFGLSGASALATAYAINELLGLRISRINLARVAHTAEVVSKTGLGDVVNQYFGGCFVKFTSSAKFTVQRLPVKGTLYCKSYDRLPTPKVLGDAKRVELINIAGRWVLTAIKKDLHAKKHLALADILGYAKEFATTSGLLTSAKLLDTIYSIKKRGGHASMIMLGNAIMSDIPFPESMKLSISTTPAHVS
ncbi:hypothetical protein A2Z00_00360 [Candidatus Gottesmanbacteria bacterium RBG_13_45_10]|uniref:GHMP kinase N-terminal domain-containing protein n=1 Tax=Candidatus Gottesmanbacteria bacterium RBG_13_45_10 TaxID=1798370 RepID=A0A1F5ZFV1_9BACT|nr:MAG: hypothetical protein A2Z00_00360 [Candidatus Gottesmanbacteria bacterium RBG_13_45_10]